MSPSPDHEWERPHRRGDAASGGSPAALLVGPALLFLALFLVLPLAIILYHSLRASPVLMQPEGYLGLANYVYIAGTNFYVGVILRTLRICAVVVVFTLLLSYPTALIFRRYAQLAGGTSILILSFRCWPGPWWSSSAG